MISGVQIGMIKAFSELNRTKEINDLLDKILDEQGLHTSATSIIEDTNNLNKLISIIKQVSQEPTTDQNEDTVIP